MSKRRGRSFIAEPLRDRDLVRLYWPVALRPAFDALFEVEDALLEVVRTSTQPALGAIRLAWWRDSFERLGHSPPPPEPRLQACATELLPRGVSGEQLSQVAEGYAALFDEVPDLGKIAAAGAALFESAAKLLGSDDPMIGRAGGQYSLGRAHRLGLLASLPQCDFNLSRHRFPKALRPLTGLARLAARDLGRDADIEPEATPARAAALLAHRMTGAIA